MKVAFHIHSLSGGGAERMVSLLCNGLCERGHEVLLVTQTPPQVGDYPLSAGVERVWIGKDPSRWRALRMLQRVLRLRTVLRESEVDVVLGFMTTSALYALLAGVRSPADIVCCERVDPKHQALAGFTGLLRRMLYPRSAVVLTQTSGAAQWFSREIPRANVAVLPNMIDYPLSEATTEQSPERFIRQDAKLVIGVGRLEQQKGFDQLIAAFSGVVRQLPEAELVILGEGSQRPALQALIDERGLTNQAHLVGNVEEPGSWYRRADVFALTSRFEGFPNVLLEAMAYGCPVVAVDCDFGPADLIEPEVNGVLLTCASVDNISQAIVRLLRDTALAETLGRSAVAVCDLYGQEKILDQWDRTLRTYCKKWR